MWRGHANVEGQFRHYFLGRHSPLRHLATEVAGDPDVPRSLLLLLGQLEAELAKLDGAGVLRRVDATTPTMDPIDVSYRYPFQMPRVTTSRLSIGPKLTGTHIRATPQELSARSTASSASSPTGGSLRARDLLGCRRNSSPTLTGSFVVQNRSAGARAPQRQRAPRVVIYGLGSALRRVTRRPPHHLLHVVGSHRVLELLLHLHLDGVDGKAVRLPRLGVVESERDLVQLEAAVGRGRRASLADALHVCGA